MFILDAIKKLDSIDSRGESNRYVMTDHNYIFCNVRCVYKSDLRSLAIDDFRKSFLFPPVMNLNIKIYIRGNDCQIQIKHLDTNYDIKIDKINLSKSELYSDELCLILSKGRSITDSHIETLVDIKNYYDKILKEII